LAITAFYPPPRESLPFKVLPRADEVIKHVNTDKDDSLYDDLITYHKSISELPDETFHDLLACWDLHTYLIESFHYSPLVWLYAIPERGKSRTGKGCIYVAYRGIHVESVREAYLFRIANDLGATIFFDVRDIWEKAKKQNSEDILLQRFEKGAIVPRVLHPDKGPFEDTKFYDIFGATLIATNEPVHKIMETRTLMITMLESAKNFDTPVTPENAINLKERLVAFRARHMSSMIPDINKPSRSRLGDILKPLMQMIMLIKPSREKAFLSLIRNLEHNRKTQLSESNEASILKAVIAKQSSVMNGLLAVSSITTSINSNLSLLHQITPHKVGRNLDAMGLGFQKHRKNTGSHIEWDDTLIKTLSTKYGVDFKLVKEKKPRKKIKAM